MELFNIYIYIYIYIRCENKNIAKKTDFKLYLQLSF
jgi:hypothetical protein